MATMQAAEQTRSQQATPRPTSGGRPSRSPSCSTVSSGSTNSLATPTNWKPEPLSTKDKQLTMERMMMNQQSQQQQMIQQQQAHMQLYMSNIVYAQHQINMQQEHMAHGWNAAPPIVHIPTSQMQRAKTIDKHIKATMLQSDVPQYQEYSRTRPKPRVVPSPASVFAQSRKKAEEDEEDDKPLAYLQDASAQKLPTIVKSQSSPNLSARKGPVPTLKSPPPAKRPAQKPHRRSPLAEYNIVAQPDNSVQDNDDLDYIIDMYQDFKVSYDTDQISVVSTGSKPDSQKSVFSWLKGTKKVKSSDRTHFKR